MIKTVRGALAATLLAGSALVATPAFADEAEAPAEFTISGSASLVTDYRFRGISLSDGDPALQGSINVAHSSGFYVGTWASSIDEANETYEYVTNYGSLEVDLYGGWSGEVLSGVTADVGLVYYYYPNSLADTKTDYFEPYAKLSTTVGPVSATLGVAYAWDQEALGSDDNLYVYTDFGFDIPETPVSLSAHIGIADGAQSPKLLTGKSTKAGIDYSVGAKFNVTDSLSLGVTYTGVEGYSWENFSDDAVVGTLTLSL